MPHVDAAPPGPRSRTLSRRLREVESRNVTWMSEDFPVFWEEARGSNVRDADGNVYLDLTGAFGVAFTGHGSPGVRGALEEQGGRLLHGMGDVHPPSVKVDLLERLWEIAPWEDSRTVLATSGSEAVEIALKTALLQTGRPGILTFEGGYHGLTLGALAATARPYFREPFIRRIYPGVAAAPFPDPLRNGEGGSRAALDRVDRLLERGAPNGDPIGAIVVEPIQGRAGVRIPPGDFLTGLSDLAREHRALVVADEIFTGLGRTGDLLAGPALGLRPDLVCLGKSLGGGLPLSACLGRRDVMDAWPPSPGEALHTSTFLGHPLACASALAALEAVEEWRLLQRARRVGRRLLEGLRDRLRGLSRVGEVRGRGLFLGIELVEGEGSLAPSPGSAVEVAVEALRKGILVLPSGDQGHVVELAPPAVLTMEQADYGAEALSEAVREVAG